MSRSILPELVHAMIRDTLPTLEGRVLSSPSLLRSGDTGELTYAVDVEITGDLAPDPSGMSAEDRLAARTLKMVPVGLPHSSLWMAQPGMFVTLRRNRNSTLPFEIIAPAKSGPGYRIHKAVNVADGTSSAAVDWSVTIEVVEFGDLQTLGGYGTVPYGARALYQGGVFVGFTS